MSKIFQWFIKWFGKDEKELQEIDKKMTKYFPNSHLWSPVNSPVEKMTYLWAGHQQLSAGISLNLQHIWRRYDTSALLDDSASSPRKLIKNDEAYVVFFSMIVWWKPNLFPESKSFHIFIRITEWSIPIWSSFKVQIPRKKTGLQPAFNLYLCSKCRTLKSSSHKLYQSRFN